jgi:hypothetical protein
MKSARLAQEQEAMRNRAARAATPVPVPLGGGGKAMWSLDEPPYTLKEAARLLQVSTNTVARLFDGEEGVLILSAPGARQKMRRIPRPVFNRVLNRLSQPQTASPYYPIKLWQPIVHMLGYPQKARRWSEDDRRKQSELMRRVHARKAAERAAWAAERAAKRGQTPRAIPVTLTPN